MHKQRTTFIFDLDGTLIDSERAALSAWQRTVAEWGVQMSDADQNLFVGHGITHALENVIGHFGLRVTVDALFDRLSEHWDAVSADGLPAVPGALALLDTLDARGIRWGIATNSETAFAVDNLSQLGILDRCGALVGSDRVARAKPAPDVYLACARLLAADPATCIAVEDSVVGHLAAAAAGMTVVAVPNQWSSAAAFARAHHHYATIDALHADLDALLTPLATSAGGAA